MSEVAAVERPLGGNAPLSLVSSEETAWQVAAGFVDVFSTDLVDGHNDGARMHLLRLEPGQVLIRPRAESWPPQLDLLAVGTVDARVRPLDRAALPADQVSVWAEAVAASAALRGGNDVPIAALREALAGGAPWDEPLEQVMQRSLQHFRFARLDRVNADQQRLLARADHDADRFQHSLTRLVQVLSPEARLADEDEEGGPIDPLEATCRLVVKSLGIDIPPPEQAQVGAPPPDTTQLLRDPVAQVARSWRLRVRVVMLRDDWYEHDCGPFVAFTEDQGRPVALIPRSANQYDMIDVGRNKYKRVNAAVAATLRPQAYMFYRPLPEKPIGIADLIKFCMFGTRRDLITVILTLLGGGLLGTVVPIVTGILVGTVIPGADRPQLYQLVLALLWTVVAMAMFSLVQMIAINRVEQNMEAPLQAAVFDRLLNLPVNFFRRYSAGDLATRSMGVSTLRRALTGATITSILGLVMSFFNLCLLFYYDTRLALLAIVLLGVQSSAFAIALRLQIARQRKVSEVQGRLSGLLLQLLTGMSKLRVAGVEDRAFGVWAKQYATQSELSYDARRVATAMATFDAVFGIFASMAVYMVVAYGGLALSTGAFLAFSAAFGSFLAAFVAMNSAVASVIAAIPSYERSLPILRTLPEVEHARAKVPVLKGDVDFSHVLFRYSSVVQNEEGEEETVSRLILNDVSLHASPGQFIAIVGPSGAGKSTIFRLLLGFEEPEAGSIYFDGEALTHLDVQAVRSQIGVVLQSGQLMSGDIFSNIVGARALTVEDAWKAAEMAGIADEIKSMPMGMHTVISEGAGNLSGGQRQRLLIARAIVGNPRVLLFDEATSALDNYTQAKVSDALRKLPATRIVIAHRLSTVQDADRIFVLKDARIAESGSFDELMANHGEFYELVQRQLA